MKSVRVLRNPVSMESGLPQSDLAFYWGALSFDAKKNFYAE
jgi:hypothetical protein